MATLVLSTVGTVFGGPIGGAIGSLVGHSIDQKLFGAGPRKGPRLGDLSVQTSTYGSPIPRIYGTMRVAGSIVWSTDLQEQSRTTSAKGEPDRTTYSYSVSFAVALSSRPVNQVRRIWADGKLIRGGDGAFKVATDFRLYPGSEQQEVDPLIASIEGISSTPAYRGTALAIFENLQLAEFGNRIPFLTFEVEADPVPPTLSDILAESSGGAIDTAVSDTVIGYAAYADSVEAAVQPLVDQFAVQLFDDGSVARSPSSEIYEPTEMELGSGAESSGAARSERSQVAAASLPSVLTLSYYDPARDYQAAQARAALGTVPAKAASEELPAVIDASSARALAETSLGRRWAERSTLRLRLPPSYMVLEPGALVRPPDADSNWTVTRVEIDSMAAVLDLRPIHAGVDSLVSDSGRALADDDSETMPTNIAVIELAAADDGSADRPVIIVGGANASVGWRAVPLDVEANGLVIQTRTAALETVLGRADTALGPGQSSLLDLEASVDVSIVDPEGWLESRDDDALVNGENLAVLGNEIFQFGSVVALGTGKFRLSRLLRGRRGTEWAIDTHAIGDTFALLDPTRLRRLNVNAALIGSEVKVTPAGLADADAAAVTRVVTGEAMRPPSPVHLRASFEADGSLACSWVRRSRLGWAWLDQVDAPLGCSTELYLVELQGASSTLQLQANAPQCTFAASDVAGLGSGPLTLTVRQVGDLAASRPASTAIAAQG